MEKIELLEKNKNKILNFGIIILALFIALQIYRVGNQQVDFLIQEKDDELKKNTVIEEIANLEKRIEAYKKVFVKKDISAVMATLSGIAKISSVKIISIKPSDEEVYPNYIKSTFLINVSAPSYHFLGDFISRIESHKDIFLVGAVSVISTLSDQDLEVDKADLNVDLQISTISYL
jgi:hypothetical protein